MNTLLTTWGEFLHPDHVLEEYPRPQMVRESYLNLNGFWDYAITEEGEFPCRFHRKRFCPECTGSYSRMSTFGMNGIFR